LPKLTQADLGTLVELMKVGAGTSSIGVSSRVLGQSMGLTQQAASKRLVNLERAGLIERRHAGRGSSIMLTAAGRQAVMKFYGDLKDVMEGRPSSLIFRGIIFRGYGEGRYYVSMPGYAKQFQEKLGFTPFPGTMNLRLKTPAQVAQRRQLSVLDGVEIHGFSDGTRTMGPVKCFRAKVQDRIPAAALAIERTHYDDSVLEVIAPANLRNSLKLEDGDECEVKVDLA
jgi:riboflavin kinase, archaea type